MGGWTREDIEQALKRCRALIEKARSEERPESAVEKLRDVERILLDWREEEEKDA